MAMCRRRRLMIAVVAVFVAVAVVVLLPAASSSTTSVEVPVAVLPDDTQQAPIASPWAPFRYVTNATPYWKVIGAEPMLANATCELMVLGHPKCDAYLTGDAVATHPEGAMMECLERYGIELWNVVLQPQCTSSAFWRDLMRSHRHKSGSSSGRATIDAQALADLMDPIMRQHLGPMRFPYVPPDARVHAPFAPPLECRPPPLDVDERALLAAQIGAADEVQRVEAMLTRSYVLPTVRDDGTGFDAPPTCPENGSAPHLGSPMLVYPIGFGYPSELLVRKPFRVKLFDWNPITPGYYPFYKPKLFKRLKKRRHYGGDARDEYVLGVLQRLTYFAWTHARGGPDCLRHYEILASGAVPYFPDIGLLPPWAVSHLPKVLLQRVLRLGGVDHMGPVDRLLPPSERAMYDQTRMPPWVAQEWKRQRMLLLRRLNTTAGALGSAQVHGNKTTVDRCSRADDTDSNGAVQCPCELLRLWDAVCAVHRTATDDITMATAVSRVAGRALQQRMGIAVDDGANDDPANTIVFGDFAATRSEWTVWLVAQQHEEYFDEGSLYVYQISIPEKKFDAPIQNDYYFRPTGAPTFNFLRKGSIRHANFSTSTYFAMADALHAHTKQYLSTSSVAAYFLNATGNESPRHVLYFGTYHCSYMAFTLWHGILALGVELTSVSIVGTSSQEVRQGPSLVPERGAPHSKLMRSFDASGAKVGGWSGAVYEAWRNTVELDRIYGRNYMVGKRIPRHPVISEAAACTRILEHAYDLIVLQTVSRLSPFGAHPCAREIRTVLQQQQQGQRDASTHDDGDRVRVAYVDGNDAMLPQVVESFHREGIQIFAREASCW